MRNEFWIISTLISIGVIGGFIYNWPTSSQSGAIRRFPDSEVIENSKIENKFSEKELQSLRSQSAEFLRKADNYLNVGNFDDALDHYAIVSNIRKRKFQKKLDEKLLFRVGLANELNGDFEKAEFFYRQAAGISTVTPFQRLLIQLAQTRNWIHLGRVAPALETLSRLYLTEEGDDQLDDQLKFEIGRQWIELSKTRSLELFGSRTVLNTPLFESCPIDIGYSIEAIDRAQPRRLESAETSEKPAKGFREIEILQNPNEQAELIILNGHTRSISVNKLLNEIAGMTDLHFQIDSKTAPYLIGRTVKVQSEAISLAVLLDVIFYPLNLSWEQNDNVILLHPVASQTKLALARSRANQAIRLGRHLAVNYPDSDCQTAVRLSSAALMYLIEEYDAASTILNQMLDENLGGELRAKIHLNIGMIEKRFERYDNAIEQFLAAVDQSLNNDLRATAYANIARIQMEQSHIEPTIIAAGRSLALTNNPVIRMAAALDMARGYLIKREPESANRVLFDHRDAFVGGAYQTLANVYGAYARSLGTLSPISKQRAIETLVISLADVRSSEVELTVDRILLAKAFTSIGLADRSIDVLVITNASPENEIWGRRRNFQLADQLLLYGNKKAAMSNYEKLAIELEDEIGQRSLLKLAEYELYEKKKPEKAIELCRKLWTSEERQPNKQNELDDKNIISFALRIMGNAYRQLGDIDSAIFCFSGRLPEPKNKKQNGVILN